MKTLLIGYALGIVTVLAYQYRAKWLPFAKKDLKAVEDHFNQPKGK